MTKGLHFNMIYRSLSSEQLAWLIRRYAIDMVHNAKASHIGGILSCADIMAVLYADIASYDINNPKWDQRDRIVLSKGHNGVAMYVALAEVGFFPVEALESYGQNGSPFSCHVSHKNVPGVEVSTGSLGHGVCMACGMALNAKIRNKKYHTYCIVGDGECNEGAVWEMAMFASHMKLNQLTVIVDQNHMQAMGFCDEVSYVKSLGQRWESFGWCVIEANGHDHDGLRKALTTRTEDRPIVVIADTVKGKGIKFMENELLWHYRDPQGECYRNAVDELEKVRPKGIIYEKSCN